MKTIYQVLLFTLIPFVGIFASCENPAMEYYDFDEKFVISTFDRIYNEYDYPTVIEKNLADIIGSFRCGITYINAN